MFLRCNCEARPGQLFFQRLQVMKDFDDLECAPIAQRARVIDALLRKEQIVWQGGILIDDEKLAARTHGALHPGKEIIEPFRRNMREPEGEENEIILLGRLPGEEVRLLIGDARISNFAARNLQHF